MGAWFEAKIVKVEEGIASDIRDRLKESSYNPLKLLQNKSSDDAPKADSVFPHIGVPDGFSYHIAFEK